MIYHDIRLHHNRSGASGLFCAASMPRPVNGLILEKTGRPGTKLLMSGSGHCNVTHSGSIKDFLKCYGENGTKIRKCLYSHNNRELISFLESMGVKTVVREDGKVFPASMSAKDILEALLDASRKNGFTIEYERPASHMKKIPGGWSVRAGNSTFTGKCLIIASGGCSYPSTGSGRLHVPGDGKRSGSPSHPAEACPRSCESRLLSLR